MHTGHFFEYTMQVARGHRDYFASIESPDEERMRLYADEAVKSIERQREIEAADDVDFDTYLKRYFAKQQ